MDCQPLKGVSLNGDPFLAVVREDMHGIVRILGQITDYY